MEFIKEEETRVKGKKNHQFPLLLYAPSGAGKSTLMATLAGLVKKSFPHSVVVSRCILFYYSFSSFIFSFVFFLFFISACLFSSLFVDFLSSICFIFVFFLYY